MNYTEFKNRSQQLPLIIAKDIMAFNKDSQAIRNQIARWQAKSLIIKLKRGIYLLNKNDRKITPSKNYIANQLYNPSYVSLETALNFYGLIPERVFDVTSITTKKTTVFKNVLGTFFYHHFKPKRFRGFVKVQDETGLSFFIAEPEKAVVDFLYLNFKKPCDGKTAESLFRHSYRFQNIEKLKRGRIVEFAGLFENDKLMKICRYFCDFIKKEAR